MGDVAKRIKQFFGEDPDFKIHENIGDETQLIESGVLDSFSVVKLMMFVEKEFNIKIDIEDLTEENISSLVKIEELVARKRQHK